MSKLSYRTIAGENPQGKPKVYFSCHPDDFATYFEEYALKILHIQDCAIWYEAEPEADYDREDLELNLAQMQLFIMPVTSKLLITPNRAMNIEFPIAQERHIPILPLMMEGSLDDVFSKRFGDLQYLDPNEKDATRRSFDEVLETYIKSVLVSSDLAKRVRAAFDAYIFLSYRKKDRKKAQELMRLIHRNPLCRDIAIWYDEFLTPGEDFNQAIGDMLTKSDLFTLVVTPNLVNEINYVMTTEYPAAIKQEKPVLPVEMEETDRAQLEEHYEALPPCVLGDDDEMLQKSLLEKIREMAISANDEDPEHNFLIGLAYLDGIDVEVDSERAMGLIKGAAEAGVPETISHLIIMYETGKGTRRDYRKGIEWREKLVELLKKRAESEHEADIVRKLFHEFWYLGDARYNLGMLNAAEDSYNEMMYLAETILVSGKELFIRFLFIRLGDIAKARGDMSGAKEYYEKVLTINEGLESETVRVAARRALSVSYDKLGDITMAQGDHVGAQTYYEKSFAISEELMSETGTVESRQNLSVSYIKLGNITMAQGDYVGAQEYYEKGLVIRENLASETETMESRRDLSINYNKLGDILKVRGDHVGAQEYYEKSLAISEELASKTGTVESRRDLSISYNKLGDIMMVRGALVGAQAYYEKSLAIREKLASETETMESRQDLSVSYNNLGDILKAREDYVGAQEYYEKGLVIRENLASETETMESRRDLSINYEHLGDILKVRGDHVGAQEYYEKSLAISEELASKTETVESRRDLSIGYNKLGEILRLRGDLARAQEYYEKGLVIREKLAGETETVELHRDLSVTYNSLGNIAESRGDLAGAQIYYEKGLVISRKLVKDTGTIESRRDLSIIYNNLGNLAEMRGDIARAQAYYDKGLTIIRKVAKETELLQDVRDYAYSCLTNGMLYYNSLHNRHKARRMFEKVMELSNEDDEYLKLFGKEAERILDKYF